jgi:hypothetical protein
MHVLAAAALALSTLVVPASDPPPEPVTAEVVTVLGGACPEGGLTISVDPKNTSFTLSSVGSGWVYVASGPGTTFRDERKPCLLGLRINPPEGYTYAVGTAEYSGYAHLEKGARARFEPYFYFQGMSETNRRQFQFEGPLFDNWYATHHVGMDELLYLPCGTKRNLNMNIEMRAYKGTSDRRLTNYLFRNAEQVTYALHWKKCS